jgi:hypothetical protein
MARWSPPGILGGRPKCELMKVGFADDYGAGVAQPGGHWCVAPRHMLCT